MKYKVKEYHHNITDEDIIEDIRKTAKKLGRKYLSKREYDARGRYHSSTPRFRFGSWNKAVSLAGLIPIRPEYVSDEELMENIKNLWDKIGRQPVMEDITKGFSRFSASAYINYYGSWMRALNEFRKYINCKKRRLGGVKRNGRKRKYRKLKFKPVSLSLRYKILKRDKFKCCICGRSPATHPGITLEVDHKIPRAKNGPTLISNLRTLCNECNKGKGANN